MAETKAQAEPTMEEILASIRRIISEDEPAGQAAAAAGQAPAAPPAKDASDGVEEILDLTRKLNEDGSVVDLTDAQSANGATAADAETEMEAMPEPAPESEPAMAAEPDPAPEAQPEPEPEVAVEPEPETEPEMAAEPPPEPEPEPEMAVAPDPSEDMAPDAAAGSPADNDESILAPETQAATTGALGAVAKAVSGSRHTVQVGDGRTLEEIVREALTPELKAWLDANLAPLVEQIVRDEIKKMVRRAEDQ